MASGEAERAARDRPGPSTARPAQAASSVPAPEPFSSMSRNNGISFSALPDVSIHDYIKAFSTTTPAECIISASRISNQRIAIYLKSKENVFSAINNAPLTKETHDDLEYDVDGTLLPSPRRAEHFADRWR